MCQANLTACIVEDSDLGGADLRGALLRCAILRRARLNGANLDGADLTSAYLGGADLTGSSIDEAASLGDARFANVMGLTAEQATRCEQCGAKFDDPEQIPVWDPDAK